jgi:Fe-S-cluster-containing dehydrogenase component
MSPNVALKSAILCSDPAKCRGCQTCALACSLSHEGECNPSLSRVLVTKDMARYEFDIVICRNCDSPACVAACPPGALRVLDGGRVLLVQEECTRCGACLDACPHHAIFYDRRQDRYLKCDMCESRLEGALCALSCPAGAITVGTRAEAGEVRV